MGFMSPLDVRHVHAMRKAARVAKAGPINLSRYLRSLESSAFRPGRMSNFACHSFSAVPKRGPAGRLYGLDAAWTIRQLRPSFPCSTSSRAPPTLSTPASNGCSGTPNGVSTKFCEAPVPVGRGEQQFTLRRGLCHRLRTWRPQDGRQPHCGYLTFI